MIRIGISACLLGDEVRYDGGHKRNAFLTEVMGPLVEWVKVCPEVEYGMGTPREPVRLMDTGGRIRLVTVKTGVDHTEAMTAYARRRVDALAADGLSGYVLKKDSPSCGMTRVKLFRGDGTPAREGVGLFARALLDRYPDLPIEEEGRLADRRLRENFVERVFAYRRLRDVFAARWTIGGLARFHAAHELVLMAHSGAAHARLGRVVARAKAPRAALRDEYTARFMQALSVIATPQRHALVLQHALASFTRRLDPASRNALQASIDDYRKGLVPLSVPITLVRRHVRQHHVERLAGQVYLDPHPTERLLRDYA